MTTYSLAHVLHTARRLSPFYRDFYKHLDPNSANLAEIPVMDQAAFWAANGITDNRVLTAEFSDGIVFKSGGTTGQPKFSAFTLEEWNTFTTCFGQGMARGGLAAGDRVANLFYAGELYASFLFIMKSIENSGVPAMHFPIAGSSPAAETLKVIADFRVNVLAGVPTTIMALAEAYDMDRARYPGIYVRKILFGGESLYPDQRRRLQEIFPGAEARSIGYASVDAGLLGFASEDCAPDEHRVFADATILELIDEDTGEIITAPDRPGKLLLTNLTRLLMPIIRYPVGDRAQWLEPSAAASPGDSADGGCGERKFLILGRSEEAARVGPVSIYYEDARRFLDEQALDGDLHISQFQMVLSHEERKDRLTFRIARAASAGASAVPTERLITAFHASRPMFAASVAAGMIHELQLEWADPAQMEVNPRTGKIKRVIDRRRA